MCKRGRGKRKREREREKDRECERECVCMFFFCVCVCVCVCEVCVRVCVCTCLQTIHLSILFEIQYSLLCRWFSQTKQGHNKERQEEQKKEREAHEKKLGLMTTFGEVLQGATYNSMGTSFSACSLPILFALNVFVKVIGGCSHLFSPRS